MTTTNLKPGDKVLPVTRVEGTNLKTERPKYAKGLGTVIELKQFDGPDIKCVLVHVRWENDVVSFHRDDLADSELRIAP